MRQESLTSLSVAHGLVSGPFFHAHPGEHGSGSSSGHRPLLVALLHRSLQLRGIQVPGPHPASLNTPCWLTATRWDPVASQSSGWEGGDRPSVSIPKLLEHSTGAQQQAERRTTLEGGHPASYSFPLRLSPTSKHGEGLSSLGSWGKAVPPSW